MGNRIKKINPDVLPKWTVFMSRLNMQLFNVFAIPKFVFLDSNGSEIESATLEELNKEKLDQMIKKLKGV